LELFPSRLEHLHPQTVVPNVLVVELHQRVLDGLRLELQGLFA